jgi:hypothetical protein
MSIYFRHAAQFTLDARFIYFYYPLQTLSNELRSSINIRAGHDHLSRTRGAGVFDSLRMTHV